MTKERIKFGIVGTGGIFFGWGGGSGHLSGCPWVADEARLVAICDVNQKSLKKAANAVKKLYTEKAAVHKENGDGELADLLLSDSKDLKLYTSLEEMLRTEKLDFVDIITPCEHHPAAIKQSLAAGCHVLCEKPLARTWLESEQIVRDVEKAGKLFLYGENFIYADPYYDIKKLIQKDEIGCLEALWVPFSISEPGNYNYTKGGVGALLDMGIHSITLAWFLIGFDYIPKRVMSLPPYGVSTRIKKRFIDGNFKELTVEDYASFVVEFEDPSSGHWVSSYLEASWSFDDAGAFRVVGSKGEIKIEDGKIVVADQFGNTHVRYSFHPCFLNMNIPPGYVGFPQQLKTMIRLVKENTPPFMVNPATAGEPLCNVKIGSESLAIAQSVYLSEAKGKKAVTLPEFKEYAKKFKKNPEVLLRQLLKTGVKR